jgi:class 3 adenylate cyclase
MIMKENENKIPSGNVTFLFTDIEGSTKLSQDFPDLLPHALDRHNEILRNAVESNNGFIFKIIGDAYCCAFEYLKDAVKAAVEAQTDLTNEKWDEAVVKVRMGIHSGNAEWNGNDYMGYITLARAARIMDAAYGEQILISSNTHSLCLEDSKILIEKKIIEKKISKEKGMKKR